MYSAPVLIEPWMYLGTYLCNVHRYFFAIEPLFPSVAGVIRPQPIGDEYDRAADGRAAGTGQARRTGTHRRDTVEADFAC